MPRGGSRVGAGRKPDPNSVRQKAAAKRAAKAAAPKPPEVGAVAGLTLPDGVKAADAPADWPFGKQQPDQVAHGAKAAPEVRQTDPDNDDGLTDEQREGLAPLDYLLAVMRSPKASKSARMQAAIQAAPYIHAKLAPRGKKEQRSDDAKKASKFGTPVAPRLAAAGGKRV